LYLLVGTELNLDPDYNPDPNPESDPALMTDPDPNLQIISDPAGSGCTTLHRFLPFIEHDDFVLVGSIVHHMSQGEKRGSSRQNS
jgi:hypothetical protein